MTPAQVTKALDRYLAFLSRSHFEPRRCDDQVKEPSHLQMMDHIYWMALETKKFVEGETAQEKIEKAMRWLGYIQAILWAEARYSIAELKDDNRSLDPQPP